MLGFIVGVSGSFFGSVGDGDDEKRGDLVGCGIPPV